MDEINRKRNSIYQTYYQLLTPLAERGLLTLPIIPRHCESNAHMFYVLLRDNATRMALIGHLKVRGILAVFHYVPLHTSPIGQRLGYRDGMLPVTEDISERLLRLPFYFELEDADIRAVVAAVFEFFSVGFKPD